ncbi:hypothetical protein AWB80_07406 [Caballeronia pedi]|uniref:Uncharacterized protein n=1 Tax=Caballeronia pedi TaxID=1777141 RepID=A0A158DT00_9BURK|nr:hypothetical protein AWB80_07406 [Caballeronia pedi]
MLWLATGPLDAKVMRTTFIYTQRVKEHAPIMITA